MRFGWMAILGLALACAAPAEAARNTQTDARTQQARPAIQASLPPRGPARAATRINAVNGRGYANPGRASARHVALRNPTSRQVAPYHRAALPSAQVRDRSGRLVVAPGYQRAMLRGQTASAACTT